MIGLSFFEHKINSNLEKEITILANNNLLKMLSFIKESYMDEDFFEIILPKHYIRSNNYKECENRFFELQELIQSDVNREVIKPLYEFILYKTIENCIEAENDYFQDNGKQLFDFKVPCNLKHEILSSYEEDGKYKITQLENINNYIDFCFIDWDFKDAELIAKCAIEYGKDIVDELFSINADDYIDLIQIDLKEKYLKKSILNKGNVIYPEEYVMNALKCTIMDFERRVSEICTRSETTISNDINMGIRTFLSDKNIVSTRETQIGRALKNLGETDFYFYSISESGEHLDIAILESKVLEKFSTQYKQLLGYLNQNFGFGITLSINKNKTCSDAKEYIINCLNNELKKIMVEGFEFETNVIEYDCKHPLVAVSEHRIPENQNSKMKVYHLMLNLSDKERADVAEQARTKKL